MKSLAVVVPFWLAFYPVAGVSQTRIEPHPGSVLVKAGKLLDVGKGNYIENAGVWIEGDRIKEAGRFADIQPRAPASARLIDLGQHTVLPGLIDCHTHLLARIPDGPDGYTLNLATKTQAFRALEGA